MKADQILIGADPEFFVAQRDRISHAIGLIGGGKHNPRPLLEGDQLVGYVQEDNVLVEINTRPVFRAEDFSSNIKDLLSRSANLLPPSFSVSRASSYSYGEQINDFPPPALVMGCDPDYDAYTGKENERPTPVEGFRSAGGHVHIGYVKPGSRKPNQNEARAVGQMCDITLGLWGVLAGDDIPRKQLYGKAGSIRYKRYGIEYRTLGNFWIWDDSLIHEVHRRAVLAYQDRKRLSEIHSRYSPEVIQEAINLGDRVTAEVILREFGYV